MYVTKENEKLYLTSWGYNCCRLMTRLACIVEEHGGRVRPNKTAMIVNRTVSELIREKEERKRFWERLLTSRVGVPEKCEAAINTIEKEIKKLKECEKPPIKVTHTTNIRFVLDGICYYYQLDENPFFDFIYSKTPVIGNKYSMDTIHVEDKKEWLNDCFLSRNCTDEDIEKAAAFIFNMLINSRKSAIITTVKKELVPNSFDGGYHYENIPNGRFGAVDF